MSKLYAVTFAVLENDDPGSAVDLATFYNYPSATEALEAGHMWLGHLADELRDVNGVREFLVSVTEWAELSGHYISRAIVQRYEPYDDDWEDWDLTAEWTPLDDVSSVSRQHFIETGRYLRVGEALEA